MSTNGSAGRVGQLVPLHHEFGKVAAAKGGAVAADSLGISLTFVRYPLQFV